MKIKIILSVASVVCLFLISGCADNGIDNGCVYGHIYGFWGGLWHGLISPFDFIGMLFSDEIAVFAPNNNGAWYTFGFLLGSGGWGALASR